MTTIGVWGPDAEAMLQPLTETDLSQAAFGYGSVQRAVLGGVPVEMFRISYVGDAGWEIYTDMGHGRRVWDVIAAAGGDFDLRPVGAGVYGTTGRLEKGYRLMGAELESEYNPVEAGLARPKVKKADFIGKEPYLAAREADPVAELCTLTIEDHTSGRDGIARFPTGGNEPILTPDGERIVDSHGRVSRVTSAGNGPSVGKFLLMSYLPPELAEVGTDLQVMYMNELYPVNVAATGADLALFDPADDRMKS
jgi:glycine cleavage system aminomethyltransferase T